MKTVKERPILFSAPMVRALLDGRKTQTRRIVKSESVLDWLDNAKFNPEFVAHPDNDMCKYGKIGDRLWVRETFCWSGYASDLDECLYRADEDYSLEDRGELKWTPSIHMPRWASRINLEITNIRVERLQDISEEDARTEGVSPNCSLIDHSNCDHDEWIDYASTTQDEFPCFTAKDSFKTLWQSINGPESWNENPWVWVIEFKRLL